MNREDDIKQLLWALRDHPWADATHLSCLCGIPRRTTYRRLRSMQEDALVWKVSVGVPGVASSLHALGRKGIEALAGGSKLASRYARAFGLDASGLGRVVVRVEELTWARNLLTSLGKLGQSIEWAVSPAFADSNGRSLPFSALACVSPIAGRYVLAGIIADTGGVTVGSLEPRLRKALRWLGRVRGRGETGGVVVVTSNAYRAAQVGGLAQYLGQKLGGDPWLYVAGVEHLAEEPRSWLVPGGGAAVYLWEGLRAGGICPEREWPVLERGKEARGGPVGTCMVPSYLGGKRVQKAFLDLKSGQWNMLRAVASWPLLRVSDLALLLSEPTGRVAGRLGELGGMDLVDGVDLDEADEEGNRYVLTPTGMKLMGATQGMRARKYAKSRLWPVGQTGPVKLRLGPYRRAQEHTAWALEFMAGLRALADQMWEEGYYHRLLVWDSHESAMWFWDDDNRRRLIRPDGGGVYQIGTEMYRFVLEVDRDSGAKRRRWKWGKYYERRSRPGPTEMGGMPIALAVCQTEGRARKVLETLEKIAAERGEPVLEAYVTTADLVRFAGEFVVGGEVVRSDGSDGGGRPVEARMWPGEKVWRRAGTSRLTWCFSGLRPSQRYPALRPFTAVKAG
jgi:hypothetical protein